MLSVVPMVAWMSWSNRKRDQGRFFFREKKKYVTSYFGNRFIAWLPSSILFRVVCSVIFFSEDRNSVDLSDEENTKTRGSVQRRFHWIPILNLCDVVLHTIVCDWGSSYWRGLCITWGNSEFVRAAWSSELESLNLDVSALDSKIFIRLKLFRNFRLNFYMDLLNFVGEVIVHWLRKQRISFDF